MALMCAHRHISEKCGWLGLVISNEITPIGLFSRRNNYKRTRLEHRCKCERQERMQHVMGLMWREGIVRNFKEQGMSSGIQ